MGWIEFSLFVGTIFGIVFSIIGVRNKTLYKLFGASVAGKIIAPNVILSKLFADVDIFISNILILDIIIGLCLFFTHPFIIPIFTNGRNDKMAHQYFNNIFTPCAFLIIIYYLSCWIIGINISFLNIVWLGTTIFFPYSLQQMVVPGVYYEIKGKKEKEYVRGFAILGE